jgi:hypothetical protein
LVPGDPIHLGACDAAKAGAGGVWFPEQGPPILWRQPLTADIQSRLVSWNNPAGDITNSDLELAGTVLHQDVLGQHADVSGETAHTFCDNTPAVFWQKKRSVTGTKASSQLLLSAAILWRRQRCNHQIQHISGDNNRMADDASQKWDLSCWFGSTVIDINRHEWGHVWNPGS